MSGVSQQVALYTQAGATWQFIIRKRDKTTGQPIALTGLKARAKFQLNGTTLLTLTSNPAAGLTVTAADGLVSVRVESTQTTTLAPGNRRTELTHGFELYDDTQTPEYVVPLIHGPLVVNPDPCP